MSRRLRGRGRPPKVPFSYVVIDLLVGIASTRSPNRAYLRHPIRAMKLLAAPRPDRLPVPVDGVRPADLVDTWHAPRSEGRVHEGIDIFAEHGTPVRSVTRGILTRKATTRRGGRVVWTLGPGGQRHYFAHLEGWADVDVGDWLEGGEVLGYAGDSGNARGTPTHLHYGVYVRFGGPTNPYPFLTSGSESP